MRTVVIIGAGFCGAVTAAQLLRKAAEPIEVILLNRSGLMARGLAYGTRTDEHVLNVPAGRMSAYADDDDSFLRYARSRDADVSANSFVSRRVFGDYLEWLTREAARAAPAGSVYRPMVGNVERIEPSAAGARIHLGNKRVLDADRVVLALGNFAPSDPQVAGEYQNFYSSPRYVRDPWRADALWVVKPDEPVFLIGTGLTMLDTLLSLRAHGHRAPIHALSRRGLLPQPHRELEIRPHYTTGLPQRLPAAPNLRNYLRELRHELELAQTEDVDWRDIIGGLRAATPALWQLLPTRERRRFMRHLRTFWDTHRHRCAPALGRLLDAERAEGSLQVHAGRVVGFDETADGVEVIWRPRGQTQLQRSAAGYVINCTGPESDTRSCTEPLIAQLREAGLIQPDELGLGLMVDSEYRLLDRHGQASPVMHYVGPFLRAQHWEATAVPELRRHVAKLAEVVRSGLTPLLQETAVGGA
jgi:uncharacterized NAD(P)/FAD-binding protein YdhS